uniref:fatty acyl-CoA reductase 1-like n=1 Tax=Bombus vancouverensis nearcticus TaxID=2705178 RepID=UPI00143A3704|nr:fatty acyl-CoA reductase 1-like [Bombus vancouverensis nearcticus]
MVDQEKMGDVDKDMNPTLSKGNYEYWKTMTEASLVFLIFDGVRAQNPTIFDKIHLVEGDVTLPDLGLLQKDRDMLIENVNIVFHVAATINFHQPLDMIVNANVKGTANIIKLCKELKHVISVVYVSTAYSNPNLSDIEEKVYTTNLDPSLVIDICDRQDKELINLLEERILKTYPNTYTFTKNLAEQTISNNSKGLTVAIVRPSIICCSLKEPYPGWLVSFAGQSGIFMNIGNGIAKVLLGKADVISDVVPIDYVVDVIMCAAWHVTLHIDNRVKVYNCTSSARPIKLGEIIDIFVECSRQIPMKNTLWYPSCTVVANKYVYDALNVLLSVLPAFAVDIFLRLQGGKPMAMNMSKFYNKLVTATGYFNSNEWSFKRDNIADMINKVKTFEDGNLVKLDLQDMDWKKYLANYLAGIKIFVLKEDSQSINTAAQRLSITCKNNTEPEKGVVREQRLEQELPELAEVSVYIRFDLRMLWGLGVGYDEEKYPKYQIIHGENLAGGVSSDVVESLAYVASSSSTTFRARKRKLTSTTPHVLVELVLEKRTSSTAHIGAELIRWAEEVIKVAMTSSSMKEHLHQGPEGGGKLYCRWCDGVDQEGALYLRHWSGTAGGGAFNGVGGGERGPSERAIQKGCVRSSEEYTMRCLHFRVRSPNEG